MDDDGSNVECIGHLNLGMAPAPGRPEGRPDHVQLAGIAGAAQRHPLGPVEHPPRRHQLGPARQRLLTRRRSPNAFHFQTQLSDGCIVVEEYYNQNNSGFGTFVKLPRQRAGRLRRRSARATCTTRATRRCGTAGSTTAGRASAACRSARTASSR